MTEWVTAYIGLGSNLGDRARTIREALTRLGGSGSIEVTRVSDLQETAPLTGPREQGAGGRGKTPAPAAQPNYLNGVAEIRTMLAPQELLERFKATEAALGRGPHAKWTARTIDLDLLLYGERIIRETGLVVPHPDIHLRSFVLDGLCQLNPHLVHPLLREPASELQRRLAGGSFVLDPETPQLVSVAGIIGVGKTTLARKLGEVLGAPVLFEPYDTNPFLPEVYAGKSELALDSQLYFLVHRARQIGWDALARGRVAVTDYVFDQEMIYARRLLNPTQLELHEKIYQPFAERVTTPKVVVYLEDSPASCLQRIHRRSRPYEQEIALTFLEAMDSDYRQMFAGWKASPVIRVPASRLTGYADAVVEHLVLQVRAYTAVGS
ncbi:MAG: 2-amino-4-hydroxy-6-hydroxymethyldihydropteridine diphosphokinase [Planctomycetes bacterium]|jgi:2-amino-4-hydroxy-6-hydroxymethyldihydropteridine diphosphokinase|nr:2-amino-4-hydroxy-6-hydroxymethyldihydropteridine diphosphokinase [Planctomycetota bacterium]